MSRIGHITQRGAILSKIICRNTEEITKISLSKHVGVFTGGERASGQSATMGDIFVGGFAVRESVKSGGGCAI